MPKRNPELASEIGHRILNRRRELGWTQERLAEESGLSQQYLACAERGMKGMGAESIIKLSKALNVSTDHLLTGSLNADERNYFIRLIGKLNEGQRQSAKEIMRHVLLISGIDDPNN